MSDAGIAVAADPAAAAPAAGTLGADPAFAKYDAETQGFFKNKGWDAKPSGEVLSALAHSYREAEKFLGAPKDELVRIPKPTDSEAVKAFREKLGAPQKPEDYDFSSVKFADGDDPKNADFLKHLAASFHAEGIAKDVAPNIAKSVVKFLEDASSARSIVEQGKLASEADEIRKNWGTNFEANKFIANSAAEKLGWGKDFLDAAAAVVGRAAVANGLLKVGQMMGEDRFVASPATGKGVMTTDQASAKLDALLGDQAWAAKLSNGDTATLAEFDALTRMKAAA